VGLLLYLFALLLTPNTAFRKRLRKTLTDIRKGMAMTRSVLSFLAVAFLWESVPLQTRPRGSAVLLHRRNVIRPPVSGAREG